MPGVVSVFRSRNIQLHTTRSWDFLGLSLSKQVPLNASSDVIVGLLDTGIWPESKSFSDAGMGPVPSRWKGQCVNGATNVSEKVICNRKVIGARYYELGVSQRRYESGRDEIGHGSHTASTAAGREVPGANSDGTAKGTARGGLPGARIAVYKVCWIFKKCSDDGILAAFDDAIKDGVDILSISLGAETPASFDQDSVAIGTFHAAQHGISISTSAGNSGPMMGSIANFAPWMLSIAASTTDRGDSSLTSESHVYLEFSQPSQGLPTSSAPVIPYFSARGPSRFSPSILKPDVAAPGVHILAAWPDNIATENGEINQQFGFLTGTSMACPHATGVIAYVKSLHPKWSPAAIKSAIMTTANNLDNTKKVMKVDSGDTGTPFDYGTGEVQPVLAADPGLVYDLDVADYVTHLCSDGFTSAQLRTISGNPNITCPSPKKHPRPPLNYPSFSFPALEIAVPQSSQRTLTNVGPEKASTYTATITNAEASTAASITVAPSKLAFTKIGQKLAYTLTVNASAAPSSPIEWAFAWISWSDGKHQVKSPIAMKINPKS
ncbi:hypothetical protein SELMODRAFT_126868 [Selaginella moellendorffii]|uniref:Peptidase S8/S53 domain-containing protein n=1 Tax=Selaginella moellendorffii TaxID=88036 RepID=D8SWY1_SELML|nr:hypothetical protein SELMODRAFT_126868 [Selaginella moellendorffii]